MSLRDQMDAIYRDLPLDGIPWNLEDPPELLVQLVESGQAEPCGVVDLGCGVGNFAVWLASKGFDVTGIDVSPRAIELAGQLASRKDVACRFVEADLIGGEVDFEEAVNFAYDWEVLHHIFPEDREAYVGNVRRLLRPGGMYLSVCFSEGDQAFGGEGKYRKTPLDTTLYFSSEQEVRDLLESGFEIEDLRTREIGGKMGPHTAIVALARRK